MAKKTMTIDDRLWNLVKDDFDMPRRQALRELKADLKARGITAQEYLLREAAKSRRRMRSMLQEQRREQARNEAVSDYLAGTLAPDLEEAGHKATADDVAKASRLLDALLVEVHRLSREREVGDAEWSLRHERDHVALGVVEPDGAGLWTKLTPRNALDLAAALTQYANDNLPTTKR